MNKFMPEILFKKSFTGFPFIYIDHRHLLTNEIIISKKKYLINTFLQLYLGKRIKVLYLLWGICGGYFLLCWEWHSLSHRYPNAHQGVKNPSLARKRPHWNGQITETTETIFFLLLPFVFHLFQSCSSNKEVIWWMRERRKGQFWWVSSGLPGVEVTGVEPWKCQSATPGVPRSRYCAHGWGPSLAEPAALLLQPQERHKTKHQAKGIIMKWMERKRTLTGTRQAPLRSEFSVGCGCLLQRQWCMIQQRCSQGSVALNMGINHKRNINPSFSSG